MNLYQLIYPELEVSQEAVFDSDGVQWGGPGRTGPDAPSPVDSWNAWKSAVAKQLLTGFTEIPLYVKDYYSKAKDFTRPPTVKELDYTLVLNNYGIKLDWTPTDNIREEMIKDKPFTWSCSALNSFESCPYAFAEERIYKRIKRTYSQKANWGIEVHDGLATRLKGGPETSLVKPYSMWTDFLSSCPKDSFLVEEKFSITKDYKPAEWFGKNVWGRGIVDVALLRGDTAKTFDWKGLALDTPLPTPTGWTTMGEIQEGELLLGANGLPCKVTAKSKIHDRRCYAVTFKDGSVIVCDDEHLWEVEIGTQHKKRIVTTPELGSVYKNALVRIKIPEPLVLGKLDLPIHPYVLGAWLGDGHNNNGEICKPDDELFEIITGFGYELGENTNKAGNKCSTRTVYGLRTLLREANLLRNKHIPPEYLRGSYEQRLQLLQGICDTDGTWNKIRKQAVITTVDKTFADSICELIRTLGAMPKCYELKKTGFGKTITAYDIAFTPINFNPFILGRKAKLVTPASKHVKNLWHRIESVELSAKVPTQCVAVASQDHLFLCGRSMIPTHNTGKRREDYTELEIFNFLLALKYPQIQKFDAAYIFLKEKEPSKAVLNLGSRTRKEVLEAWMKILTRIKRMEEAVKCRVFSKKTSGSCAGWCSITDCEHWKEKR